MSSFYCFYSNFDQKENILKIAKDVTNRIELSIQLGRLRQISTSIIDAIERNQMQLIRLIIPGNQQEVDLEMKHFHDFRIGIEVNLKLKIIHYQSILTYYLFTDHWRRCESFVRRKRKIPECTHPCSRFSCRNKG